MTSVANLWKATREVAYRIVHHPRRWYALGVLLLGLVLIGSFLRRAYDHSGISEANFDKIEVGMMLPEVESLMGGPSSYAAGSGLRRVWYVPYRIAVNSDSESPWISLLMNKSDMVMAFVVDFNMGPSGQPGTVLGKHVEVGALPDEIQQR